MTNTIELAGMVIATFSIECEKCCEVVEASSDVTSPFGAAEDFNADGWKVIDGEATCPVCVEATQPTASVTPLSQTME